MGSWLHYPTPMNSASSAQSMHSWVVMLMLLIDGWIVIVGNYICCTIILWSCMLCILYFVCSDFVFCKWYALYFVGHWMYLDFGRFPAQIYNPVINKLWLCSVKKLPKSLTAPVDSYPPIPTSISCSNLKPILPNPSSKNPKKSTPSKPKLPLPPNSIIKSPLPTKYTLSLLSPMNNKKSAFQRILTLKNKNYKKTWFARPKTATSGNWIKKSFFQPTLTPTKAISPKCPWASKPPKPIEKSKKETCWTPTTKSNSNNKNPKIPKSTISSTKKPNSI